MDRELWAIVMASIHCASRAVIDVGRRPTWPHWLIVAMELWRVWHGRTLSWACDRSHYGDLLPPCVRRLERVRRWVGVKIILYHARLGVQERAAAA